MSLRGTVSDSSQATQPTFGQGTAVAADLRRDVSEHLALLDLLAGQRQAAWPRCDPAGDDGLHFAAGIRVHDHLAGQFMGTGQFTEFNQQGANTDLALRRFGQEDAAVRLAFGAVAAGGWRGVAMIMAVTGQNQR